MQNGGVVLSNTSLIAVGSNVTDPKGWNGAKGVLVIGAQQFAPTVNLVLLGVGNQSLFVPVNSGNIAANGVLQLSLPAGQYQIHSAGGTSIGLYASLMPTP